MKGFHSFDIIHYGETKKQGVRIYFAVVSGSAQFCIADCGFVSIAKIIRSLCYGCVFEMMPRIFASISSGSTSLKKQYLRKLDEIYRYEHRWRKMRDSERREKAVSSLNCFADFAHEFVDQFDLWF